MAIYEQRSPTCVGQTLVGDGGREEVVDVRQVGDLYRAQTVPAAGARRLGYARVSTADQDRALQLDALAELELDAIFEETASGAGRRPELQRALSLLSAGDELWVWRLDRLGRSTLEILTLLEEQADRGVAVRCVAGPRLEPDKPEGKLLVTFIAALAEFERDLLIERTRAGLAAARRRGVKLGRRPALNGKQRAEVVRRVRAGEWTPQEAGKLFGVSARTVRRYVRRAADG